MSPTKDDGNGTPRFHLSREVRLGDVLTVAGVALMLYAKEVQRDFRVEQVERSQATQDRTNAELRNSIREVGAAVVQDIKEIRGDVRDLRDRVNRARL